MTKKFVIKTVDSIGLVNVLAESFTIEGGFFIFKDEGENIAAFKAEDVQHITGSEMILTLGNGNNHIFNPNVYSTRNAPVQKYSDTLNIS